MGKSLEGLEESSFSITVMDNPIVFPSDLESIFDHSRFSSDISNSFTSFDLDSDQRPGIVYDLDVMGQGEGGILPVGMIHLPGSNGRSNWPRDWVSGGPALCWCCMD